MTELFTLFYLYSYSASLPLWVAQEDVFDIEKETNLLEQLQEEDNSCKKEDEDKLRGNFIYTKIIIL